MKSIDKSRVLPHPHVLRSLEREVTILRQMSHPRILKLFEVYEDELYVHMVLEYLGGGELFKRLDSRCGLCPEDEIRQIARCVLEALEYCHARGIVHRDLKPENIVFEYRCVVTR